MNEYISTSVEQTKKIAYELAKSLKKGDILCLYGDLGAGKTSFVQGIAKGLGIKKRIISPTFIIIRSYKVKNAYFFHMDLYRTADYEDLISLGLDEIINGKENILAIEWAEKLGKILPRKRIDMNFTQINLNTRKITINRYE